MCCFSKPVLSVSKTNIFARPSSGDRQLLVYGMNFESKDDLAMILPLPVPEKSKEDAVKFIDLKGYPKFFDDLHAAFRPPPPRGAFGDKGLPGGAGSMELKVVKVGEFEASFVPTVADFKRLDERFRLQDEVWEKLPQYARHGFAVFKLKKGAQKVHPMAFVFPRANARELFFPTVHIHDGEVHDEADFDHSLFCQVPESEVLGNMLWQESPQLAREFMNIDRSRRIVAEKQHVYFMPLKGKLENRDWIVGKM